MDNNKVQVFVCVYSLLQNVVLSSDFQNTDSHYERCKEFEKEMGKPNIYYNENNDLVMLVKVYPGASNRVIDSGVNSVGIQLKEGGNINEELVRFLCQVLNVKESFITVLSEGNPAHKSVIVKGTAITAYELIDKLVAALEVTAREEPLALCVTDSPNSQGMDDKSAPEENDITREFVWRNNRFE